MAVHLAVAGDSLVESYFVLSFFQRDVLDEILDLTESVREEFFYLLLNITRKRHHEISFIAK